MSSADPSSATRDDDKTPPAPARRQILPTSVKVKEGRPPTQDIVIPNYQKYQTNANGGTLLEDNGYPHNNSNNDDDAMHNDSTGSLPPPPAETADRAVHCVSLASLSHNYHCVQQTAQAQRCEVIVVVKADGYGHGAIATAQHLVQSTAAEDHPCRAFAVATLEEAIALRQALSASPSRVALVGAGGTATGSAASSTTASTTPPPSIATTNTVATATTATGVQPHVRILVLGPPVGFPRCFDDYFHYNIEVMVSGPEVAAALLAWVADRPARQHQVLARQAQQVLDEGDTTTIGDDDEAPPAKRLASSTVSNARGQDLAKEFRAILQQRQQQQKDATKAPAKSAAATVATASITTTESATANTTAVPPSDANVAPSTITAALGPPLNSPSLRKRLRWHAGIDTGMGRLGFKAEPQPGQCDAVDIIQELVEAELSHAGKGALAAPLEFYGICTHMADATNEESGEYTHVQMDKFVSFLQRVRAQGISVPTVSTDNSAALLSPSLTHFDAAAILPQGNQFADTHGFVRTGGAIYGQRPAFPQLRPVSTLIASVRHVAILHEGDSVGYDRAYVAPHAVRIATLTVGFADGYPRALGNGKGGRVAIRGRLYPIVGNICMDMLMVDLGSAEPTQDGQQVVPAPDVQVGDIAVLWGSSGEDGDDDDGVALQTLAETLGTTQSAMTCGLTQRVRRQYK